MKVDFVLFYEHWKRELYGIMQVAAELKRRGYRVRVISLCPLNTQYWVGLESYFYEPEVVVFPWIYKDYEVDQARDFRHGVYKLVNMQCEQVLSERVVQNGFFRIKESAVNAYHVSWGENSTKRFLESGVSPSHIWQVGNINLDMNRERYGSLFLSREEIARRYHLDCNKKWILYCSNFKLANVSEEELKIIEKRSAGVTELGKHMRIAQKETLDWLLKLSEQSDEVEIIYRMHPTEAEDKSLEHPVLGQKNFHCIRDYSINQWSRVCDCALSWGSTALLDAAAVGKPSAFLRPYPIPDSSHGDMDGRFRELTAYEEMKDFLQDTFGQAKKQFGDLIDMDDDRYTYERLCDHLEELYHEKKDEKLFDTKRSFYKPWRDLPKRRKKEAVYIFLSKYCKLYVIYQFLKEKNVMCRMMQYAYEEKKNQKRIWKQIKKIKETGYENR